MNVALGATNNTVGGTAAGAGNVISGSVEDGVGVGVGNASDNVVAGNLIGTNAAGTAALGNGGDGVDLTGPATGNTIGGTIAAARNVISGNTRDGVDISGRQRRATSSRETSSAPTSPARVAIANATGVELDTGASGNTIGGTDRRRGQYDRGQHQRRRAGRRHRHDRRLHPR